MLRKSLLLTALLPLTLLADVTLYPKEACLLYNNLKHTKSTQHLKLNLHQTYEMLQHHKGQYLLKVPEATPSQLWVDDGCLTLRPLRSSPLYGKKETTSTPKVKEPNLSFSTHKPEAMPLLLALSWHNSFCETHRYKKECKRGSFFSKNRSFDNHFVLHGLWPQPRENLYCDVPREYITLDKHKQWHKLPALSLSQEERKTLSKAMPGVASNLHRHEWYKHGTCYKESASRYFGQAQSWLTQLNESKVGRFFANNAGKVVTLQQVRYLFNQSFGKGSGKRVELRCQKGLISELWLHLGAKNSSLEEALKEGKPVHSRCQKGRIDKAGFGR